MARKKSGDDPCTTGQPVTKKHRTEGTNVAEDASALASNEEQELQPAPAFKKDIQNALHLFDGIAELASKVRDVDLNKESLRKILAKITNADHIAAIEQLLPAPSEHADKLQKAWTKAVTYVLCAPYCKTTTLANLAAAFPKGEQTCFNNALKGNFTFAESLEGMDASIGNDPMQRLTNLVPQKVKDNFGKPWIMSKGTEGTLTDRHVKVDCVATLFTMDKLSKGSALPIVSGESGAGKTNGVLLALPDGCIGLYATPRDFGDTWQDELWNDGKRQDERDEAASKVVEHLLKILIPADVAHIVGNATSGKPTAFYLVMDEVGSCQQLLRALCSINRVPISHLGVPVKMIAIGSGADTNAVSPGSHPDYYHLFRVEANGDLWSHIIEHADKNKPSDEFLRKINEDDVGARALGGNARVAALMVQVACQLPASSLVIANKSRRARDALCVTFFANVATEFRLKNGMSKCTEEMVQSAFKNCARAVLFLQRGDVLEKSEAAVAELHKLVQQHVHEYGLLTDDARRILTAGTVPNGYKEYPSSRDSTSKLVAPFDEQRGVFKRFRMSPAQQTLFRLHYGYATSFRSDGDGFEEVCLQLIEFALLGASGGTVLELLQLLNGNQRVDDAKTLGAIKLRFSAVRVLQSNEKVEPGMTLEGSVLEDVKKFVTEGAAVVLRNASKAPFADVLVFLPNVGVILVQNKFVQQFDVAAAEMELFKMGHEGTDADKHAHHVRLAVDGLEYSWVKNFLPDYAKGNRNVNRLELTKAYIVGYKEVVKLLTPHVNEVVAKRKKVALLHKELREVVKITATPFIKLCLMTSLPRLPKLPKGTLQFHATEETMTPVVFSKPGQASTPYTELSHVPISK